MLQAAAYYQGHSFELFSHWQSFVVSLYDQYDDWEAPALVDRLQIFGCKQDSSDDACIELHDAQDQGQEEYESGFMGWVQGGLIATRLVEGQVVGKQALQVVLVTTA